MIISGQISVSFSFFSTENNLYLSVHLSSFGLFSAHASSCSPLCIFLIFHLRGIFYPQSAKFLTLALLYFSVFSPSSFFRLSFLSSPVLQSLPRWQTPRAVDSRYFSRDRRIFLALPPGAIVSSAPSLKIKMADALEPYVLRDLV